MLDLLITPISPGSAHPTRRATSADMPACASSSVMDKARDITVRYASDPLAVWGYGGATQRGRRVMMLSPSPLHVPSDSPSPSPSSLSSLTATPASPSTLFTSPEIIAGPAVGDILTIDRTPEAKETPERTDTRTGREFVDKAVQATPSGSSDCCSHAHSDPPETDLPLICRHPVSLRIRAPAPAGALRPRTVSLAGHDAGPDHAHARDHRGSRTSTSPPDGMCECHPSVPPQPVEAFPGDCVPASSSAEGVAWQEPLRWYSGASGYNPVHDHGYDHGCNFGQFDDTDPRARVSTIKREPISPGSFRASLAHRIAGSPGGEYRPTMMVPKHHPTRLQRSSRLPGHGHGHGHAHFQHYNDRHAHAQSHAHPQAHTYRHATAIPDLVYSTIKPRFAFHPYATIGPSSGFLPAAMHAPPHTPVEAWPVSPRIDIRSIGRGRSTDSVASPVSANCDKGPRKRADDVQLAVLNAAFDECAYPSTAERERLARRLGMTSRSVQIWFQNRRRAVKVEQQSSVQRIEAELIATRARARGLPGPPYLNEAIVGSDTPIECEIGGREG